MVYGKKQNSSLKTVYLMPDRIQGLVLIIKIKRTGHLVVFTVPADQWVELKECRKLERNLDITRKLKEIVEPEGDVNTKHSWSLWNSHQDPCKKTQEIEEQKKNRDHLDYSTTKICKET